MNDEPTITISLKYYTDLKRDSITLSKLEAAGVDNWEWYGEALYGDEDDFDDEDDE